MKYKVLDLFSGIGGFSLGMERTGGFETVAFCEIEKYPRYVLQKHWPDVPIFEDVKDLYWFDVGHVDVICGGFPCQDISVAGKQKGLKGERSGLWSEFKRLIEDFQPKWAIIENVSNLRSKGLVTVLQDLWEIGYDAQWHCIPASALGAPHRRDRIWIIAYPRLSVPDTDEVQCSECRREQEERTEGFVGCSEVGLESRGIVENSNPIGRVGRSGRGRESEGEDRSGNASDFEGPGCTPTLVPNTRISDGDDKETNTQCSDTLCERHQLQEVNEHRGSELRDEQVSSSDRLCGDVPNTSSEGLQRRELIREVEQRKGTWLCESLRSAPQQNTIPRAKSYWAVEPSVGRVVNGVPKRVDRIKCLGNAVVPIIPQLIGEAILKCDRDMADFCDLL